MNLFLDILLGLLGRAIGRRKASTFTEQYNREKRVHQCYEWNSKPRTQCSSGQKLYVS